MRLDHGLQVIERKHIIEAVLAMDRTGGKNIGLE